MTIFYSLRSDTPPIWRARSPYLYLQVHGGPVIHPGTGFFFRRLLRLTGLWWRYSKLPPHGERLTFTIGPRYIASAQTVYNTRSPTLILLLPAYPLRRIRVYRSLPSSGQFPRVPLFLSLSCNVTVLFHIKLVTLDRITFHLSMKQCDASK
jgi:hypothetical protein